MNHCLDYASSDILLAYHLLNTGNALQFVQKLVTSTFLSRLYCLSHGDKKSKGVQFSASKFSVFILRLYLGTQQYCMLVSCSYYRVKESIRKYSMKLLSITDTHVFFSLELIISTGYYVFRVKQFKRLSIFLFAGNWNLQIFDPLWNSPFEFISNH